MSVVPDRRYAWRLVQLAELLRRSHRLHEWALVEIDRIEVAAQFVVDGSTTLGETTTAELEAYGEAIADLAYQLRVLTNDLPTEAVEITAGEVACEAAADLEAGIFDEHRVLLAARVLTVEDGWPALAASLHASDAHWGWDTTSVAGLLRAFRGADALDVARVVEEAGIEPDALFSLCAPEQIRHLATKLEEADAA